MLRLLASVLSAGLMIAAFPGNPLPLLVWVCLVPWLLALRNAGAVAGALYSLLFSGIVWLLYLWQPFYESAITITKSAGLAVLLTALHLFSYMLPFVVLGLVHRRFNDTLVKNAVILASILTLVTFATPTLFSFNLGSFLYEHPLSLQLLDLSGTSLLLWAIVLVNILLRNVLVAVWENWRSRKRILSPVAKENAVALLVLASFVVGYGLWQLDFDGKPGETAATRKSLRIASIQPNMGPAMRPLQVVRDNREARPFSHIEHTRRALRDHGTPDLVVWPENGLAVACDDPIVSRKISEFAASIAIPIMHQCVDCASRNGEGCYNQSRYVDANGVTIGRYNKRNLVPLFERMPNLPLGSMIGSGLRQETTFLVSGNDPVLFIHDKARIIPAICFDAQSPDLLRTGLEQGGQVVIVQSNDRIFKMSKIGLFDLAINIAGAVAMRVPMVKVSNSGYGAFLQTSGRLVPDSITPVNTALSSVHTLLLEPRSSIYRKYGNWFIYVVGVIVLLSVVSSVRRDRASPA